MNISFIASNFTKLVYAFKDQPNQLYQSEFIVMVLETLWPNTRRQLLLRFCLPYSLYASFVILFLCLNLKDYDDAHDKLRLTWSYTGLLMTMPLWAY